MGAQICVAICQSTSRETVEAMGRAAAWADLVEIRADYIHDPDPDVLFRAKPRPVIFTLRSRAEGGRYEGSEHERLETIIDAARRGADYVDVEFSSPWRQVMSHVPRERVILSSHNFDDCPDDLESLLESMAATGAGVLKIAVRARCLSDNLRVAGLLARAKEKGLALCALAMGRAGLPSRILGSSWGSWMTFASLPGGEATAEGQIPADEMTELYRVRAITPETQLYGVLGKPLAHSLSPRIHNAAFAARGIGAVLLPLEASSFEDFLRFHEALPLQGVAVTIPYKGAAHAAASTLSAAAEQTGAVNTLMLRSGRWQGDNTDVEGFLQPLKRRMSPVGLQAVVLGAGGAARAAIYALRKEGARVAVAARDAGKAGELAAQFQIESVAWDRLESLRWDLLVNATPAGMYPEIDKSPVPAGWLTGKWVYDLVYNPAETQLLKDAAKKGCKIIPGAEMFVGQAWNQQILWCGTPPPEGVLDRELTTALRSDQSGPVDES